MHSTSRGVKCVKCVRPRADRDKGKGPRGGDFSSRGTPGTRGKGGEGEGERANLFQIRISPVPWTTTTFAFPFALPFLPPPWQRGGGEQKQGQRKEPLGLYLGSTRSIWPSASYVLPRWGAAKGGSAVGRTQTVPSLISTSHLGVDIRDREFDSVENPGPCGTFLRHLPAASKEGFVASTFRAPPSLPFLSAVAQQ